MLPPTLAERYSNRLQWDHLDRFALRQLVEWARGEDLDGRGLARPPERRGDVTSALLRPGLRGKARIVAREPLVLCGLELVPVILDAYGGAAAFHPRDTDGARVEAGTTVATLEGSAAVLLSAERVILNFLQHLSGIATNTRRHADALGSSPTRLLDTRKTTPGYRMLEKYAVGVGGGWNHRLGLFDRVMIKDNHLAADNADSGEALAEAVRRARKSCPDLVVETEIDRLDQLPAVLEAGSHIVLLDNFTDAQLREAVALVDGRAATEASGGITLERLPALGGLGLDFISTGAVTHRSRWVDLGIDWIP